MTAGRPQDAPADRDNVDEGTIASFGDEWSHFDQTQLSDAELGQMFEKYFSIFPWPALRSDAEGFDMGCGSGRWAKLVAPRVGRLNCIDASPVALDVARRNLAQLPNIRFIESSANRAVLGAETQDFGYCLGVLHHIPDSMAAIRSCVDLLKPGAPFLVYIYYRFDNRPFWFRLLWHASDLMRTAISRLPARAKNLVTDAIAVVVYWPLARLSRLLQSLRLETRQVPLQYYSDKSLYTMRTDSRDRFGTSLEQRFTRSEIKSMMELAGLTGVRFSEEEPYWCAVGFKQ